MKFVIGSALAAFSTLCLVNTAFAHDTQGAAPTQKGAGPASPPAAPQVTTVVVVEPVPPTSVAPPMTPQESYSEESYTGLTYTEERSYWNRAVGAPRGAFELGITTGYAQGFGEIGANRRVGDVAGPGVGVGLSLGYRTSPGISVGLTGTYQELSPTSALASARARGMTGGIDVTFHMSPYQRVDAWASLGTGYRLLWDVGAREPITGAPSPVAAKDSSILRHGFQLVKLQLGFDIRLSRSVGIGPLIGADLNSLMWRDDNLGEGSVTMSERGLSTFIYGGLGGRFDFGGDRVDEWTANIASR